MAITDKLKAIADSIRSKTGKTEEMTLDQMPGEIEGISSGGGYDEGYAEGREAGYADGEQAEHDRFWDAVLNPPHNYVNWGYRFAGYSWNDATFKPPCDIVPIGSATMMFANSPIAELKALCDKQGIVIDFSKTTSFSQMFTDASITHVGTIDTRSATSDGRLLLGRKCRIGFNVDGYGVYFLTPISESEALAASILFDRNANGVKGKVDRITL